MGKERKRFAGAFKAKVALEAVKGVRSVNELASLYGVHPTQIATWKKRVLEGLAELLADGREGKDKQEREALVAQLYQQIGQLKVECDFLKKKTGLLG